MPSPSVALFPTAHYNGGENTRAGVENHGFQESEIEAENLPEVGFFSTF